MERPTSTEGRSVERLLAALDGNRPRETAAMVARVEEALDAAADPRGSPSEARELDQAAVRAVELAPDRDPILERIDLDRFLALLARIARRLQDADAALDAPDRRVAWDALDLVRRPAVLRRVEPQARERWALAILDLVVGSHLTVGPLLRQRVETYGSKTLFDASTTGHRRVLSWDDAAARVESLARLLLSLGDGGEPPRVALLSENRLELALLDLACLSTGIVDVLVPANATDADVGYILRHSGAGVAIVSDREQARKVLQHREALARPARVIALDPVATAERDVDLLDALRSRAESVPRALVQKRSEQVRIDDLATVMYTSGTTGMPKGIPFTQRNIVFKRFARALALPELGENDVFLCYLPLFHTFGRYLELLGCVFWGARYCFLDGTSPEALARGLLRFRPTAFISVPKKWMQLHEMIAHEADPLEAGDAELAAAVQRVTGGRLRFGLSAAGHLDPEIFRFFARHGVELLSGFGMTEATGGITMTAPGDYRDGSLGRALPGIELRLAADGELLVRGPYVMTGYLDPEPGESAIDGEGFLHTGDLMEADEDGHLRLVDRKKEIYKNLQGQTIAPQRVENHFRDFGSVGRAFLVGDHREYNTLLVWPNRAYRELDLAALPAGEVAAHFRSLVVSVNKFLAPYERIVDFAIIDRDLDAERGELTPKGTPRRKTVERNFAEVIRDLYRRANLRVGGVDLVFPNWLFQILGLTARDVRAEGERIVVPASGATLSVRARTSALAEVGSCLYRHRSRAIDLGTLLTSPPLWLGNEELHGFVALDSTTRQRRPRRPDDIEWAGRARAYAPSAADRDALARAASRTDLDLADADLGARMLASPAEADALPAVALLEGVLAREEGPLHEPARLLLERLVDSPHPEVRRRAFRALVPAIKESRLREVISSFLARDPDLVDEPTRDALCERTLARPRLEAFVEAARDAGSTALLEFLAAYGAGHPIAFRRLRAFLERTSALAPEPAVREAAARAGEHLLAGFRQWLGPSSRIAVDPETGQEYRWEEVVAFDDDVPASDRQRILSALKNTALLREAVFLFSQSASVRLSDIPPGGVWIRMLGARHGKAVYRATVQAREAGPYDLAINVNHDLAPQDVREEIRWLILCGDPGSRNPLVEDFGGYWPDQDLWTEEFIAGETLDRSLPRLVRLPDGAERVRRLWPFFAWATLAAYVEFWHRTGCRLEIGRPDPTNIVVPTEDYVSGVRLVSLTNRRPHGGLLGMLGGFHDEFIVPAEQQYPALAGLVGWEVVFAAVLEVLGEANGLAALGEALARAGDLARGEMPDRLRAWIAEVERRGFTPLRLHSAIERYRRWEELNAEPTTRARALTLQELYETYGLQRLSTDYPEIRVRFFLGTVFRHAAPDLTDGLGEIVRALRERALAHDELLDAVDALRARLKPAEEDEYFLARMSYPYLRPEDSAGFVRAELGGKRLTEIVVTLEDQDGRPFSVRHALNPKEVERLLQLFLAAKLDVRFRMEHRHLVAVSDRGPIIGGIYYEIDEEGRTAHLEKIVVAERFRRKGVATGLMNEFFNRLRAAGVSAVTTGFFRPEYFYGFGFRIEKRYAGLVKSLESESTASGK